MMPVSKNTCPGEASWQYKVLWLANRLRMYTWRSVLLSITRQEYRVASMCFRGTATISAEGFLTADYLDNAGVRHNGALVMTAQTYIDGLRRFADRLKLSDADRVAFFKAAREWVGKDDRPEDQKRLP